MNSSLTVLMSVYKNTVISEFEDSVLSVINQTLVPDFIFIGIDGEISENLHSLIIQYSTKYNFIKLFYFENNVGLGNVLSVLSKEVSTPFISRMDTDDIALPNRFELMMSYLISNDLDLLGSYILEFTPGVRNKYLKTVPLTQSEIRKYSKYRNPFNHVTVLMRKTVLDVFNYEDCKFAEDWYLWLRIIESQKFKLGNMPIPTVLVNVSNYSRLSGFLRFKIEFNFFHKFYKEGFINLYQVVFNVIVSFFTKFVFAKLIKIVYKKILRVKYVE
jgi:hypothetical protein